MKRKYRHCERYTKVESEARIVERIIDNLLTPVCARDEGRVAKHQAVD